MEIIASSAISASGDVFKTQLDKHATLTAKVPTVKYFMSPKPGLFVQETPNNSGCGINNPLGTSSRVAVLTRDLHDAGVLSES